MFVDGIGRLSHPIKLRARRKALTSFSPAEQTTIRATQDKQSKSIGHGAISITLLEDDETLGTQVEQWAVEYASKFVHAAGPKFRSTTIAVIIGTAYVKKGLPEVKIHYFSPIQDLLNRISLPSLLRCYASLR